MELTYVTEDPSLMWTKTFKGQNSEGIEVGIFMRSDETFEINIITGNGEWHRIDMPDGTIKKMAVGISRATT